MPKLITADNDICCAFFVQPKICKMFFCFIPMNNFVLLSEICFHLNKINICDIFLNYSYKLNYR